MSFAVLIGAALILFCLLALISVCRRGASLKGVLSFGRQYPLFSAFIAIQLAVLTLVVFQSVQGTHVHVFNASNAYVNEYAKHVIHEDASVSFFSDGSNYRRNVLLTPDLRLPSSAYRVTLRYDSQIDEASDSNFTNSTGQITFSSSDLSPYVTNPQPLQIRDGLHEVSQQFRLGAFQELDGSELFNVEFFNNGTLRIYDLTVEEILPYRIVRVISYLLLFALLDWLFIAVLSQENRKLQIRTAALISIILFSSLPSFSDFVLYGHDLAFHLNRIVCLSDEIRNGNLFPYLYTTACAGYTYANPIFYGHLLLYIPALLYTFGVPLAYAYNFFVILINALTCLISYFCFRALVKKDWIALLGSALYTLSAYRLVNVFLRAAVGEYTAMAFLPLIFAGFFIIYSADRDQKISFAPICAIAFGLSGAVQSHILSVAIAAVFIILLVLIRLKDTLCKNRFFALSKAALLTFLLNAFHLVPFISSYAMDLNTHYAEPPVYTFSVYPIQLFNPVLYGNQLSDVQRSYIGEMPLNLGFSLTIALCSFFWLYANRTSIKQRLPQSYSFAASSFALASVALFLCSTLMPWNLFYTLCEPVFRFIQIFQFPWRFLCMATVASAFVAIFFLSIFPHQPLRSALSMIMLASAVLNASLFFNDQMVTSKRISPSNNSYEYNDNISGWHYLPHGTDRSIFVNVSPVPSEGVTITSSQRNANAFTITCENAAAQEAYIDLPLLCYDNYRATQTDTQQPLALSRSDDGKLRVLLPAAFSGAFHVEYVVPTLWKISSVVSLVTLLGILAYAGGILCAACRKPRAPR